MRGAASRLWRRLAISVAMAALPPCADEPLDTADFERAAEHFNTCRARGVQGSNTDFLICAVAERRKLPILTNDADFSRVAAILPVTLHGRQGR
ncbi:MAG: hypothetical protein DMF86_14380 [Acidobacteria bacterium]|nr:MAG: hypothetical protein DMF86_14380 [Acidobacteriota bacterium]